MVEVVSMPLPLRHVRVLFSPMVSGWASHLAIVTFTFKIVSGNISETVRYRKLTLGRDIGWKDVGVNVMV